MRLASHGAAGLTMIVVTGLRDRNHKRGRMRKLGCFNPEEFAASAGVAGLEDSFSHA